MCFIFQKIKSLSENLDTSIGIVKLFDEIKSLKERLTVIIPAVNRSNCSKIEYL